MAKTYADESVLYEIAEKSAIELERMFGHTHGYTGYHFERLGSFGCPPPNFPLNRGEWFDTVMVLRDLDGDCLFVRKQSIYTGTEFPSKEPRWFVFGWGHLVEAEEER